MDAGVQGYPYPWVSWSHNDLLLQNTSNVDSQTSLKIRNVTVSKGGLYTCYAKNSAGHHILTFKVYVEGTDFICMLDSFVRVDVTCQERETQWNFALCILLISFIVLCVVCHFFCLFVFVFCFFFSWFLLFPSVLFWIFFSSKPTSILARTYTLAQMLPIFFPLYLGQAVRTTTGLGRFFRSLTFSDDLKRIEQGSENCYGI